MSRLTIKHIICNFIWEYILIEPISGYKNIFSCNLYVKQFLKYPSQKLAFYFENLIKAQLKVQISPQQLNEKLKSNYILKEQSKLYSNKFWFIQIYYEISWKGI